MDSPHSDLAVENVIYQRSVWVEAGLGFGLEKRARACAMPVDPIEILKVAHLFCLWGGGIGASQSIMRVIGMADVILVFHSS